MRGSPFWQVVLVAAVFTLAGLPVWRLTQAAPGVATPVANTSKFPADLGGAGTQTVDVQAEFAPPPRDFQIKYLDKTVLEGHGPAASFATRWPAALTADGADLVVRARWDATATGSSSGASPVPANPSAAHVTLSFADGRRIEKSFWATGGSLAEVFTVPGSSPSP